MRAHAWPPLRRRRTIAALLAAAIALPLSFTLVAFYPLFFALDHPRPDDIAGAIAEALNCVAFGVLLDAIVLLSFVAGRVWSRVTSG